MPIPVVTVLTTILIALLYVGSTSPSSSLLYFVLLVPSLVLTIVLNFFAFLYNATACHVQAQQLSPV